MTDIEPASGAKTDDAPLRVGITGFEQSHLMSYMQLADAKASVFLAIASGAVAYIAGHYGLGWLREADFLGHTLLLSFTTVVLAASAAFAIAVIVPRKSWHWRGVIFYHDVAQIASPDRYADALLEMSDRELFRAQATYCFALAKICSRKYRLLNISLILGIVGYAGFLALLLWR